MNIFYLNHNPKIAAQEHMDKHVVKMILEYTQLLSTAHRVLDGLPVPDYSKSGRRVTRYKLDKYDDVIYQATHVYHPSAVWTRASKANYEWLYQLLVELCKEYAYRYGKTHSIQRSELFKVLKKSPRSISLQPFTQPTPAMPLEMITQGDSITSYKKYYIECKNHLAVWSKRNIPEWYLFSK
jgi:hypothetical protein